MYSQCPECQTRFRVTAAALRAARGTVRCGRCGSAFDALRTLTDSLTEPPPVQGSVLALAESAYDPPEPRQQGGDDGVESRDSDGTIITEFHFSADDIEQVFIDAREWQRQFGSELDLVADLGPDALGDAAGRRDDASRRTPSERGIVYVHEPESIEDITLEGERIVIEEFPQSRLEPQDPVREDAGADVVDSDSHAADSDDAVRLELVDFPDGPVAAEPVVDLDATDRYEILRLQTPAPGTPTEPSTELATARDETPATPALEPVPEPEPESAAAAPAPVPPPPAVSRSTAVPSPTAVPSSAAVPPPQVVPFRLRQRSPADEEAPVEEAFDAEEAASGGGRAAALWGVGAVALLVALLAQAVHHYRQELARDARVGPALRTVYARIGLPLAPNWDLAAFELQQWGAGEPAPSAGAMTVRASLRNGAGFAQPMPLLRMELEDRYGETVARRDFKPGEYLKDPAQAGRLLEPGAKTEAELDVVDVGPDAVGYRLDVCLPEAAADVRCAQSVASGGRPR